jgi:type VI secretion system secreted protein Hcp
MAYDAYLKIDGIKGESKDAKMKDQIDLYSFSWGASNPTTMGRGGGAAGGKVSLSSFNFLKKTDAASPKLFEACCNGTHIKEAVLTLRKAGGKEALNYLEYKFSDLFIDSVQWSGSAGGDETPTESVSFAFAKVQITYTEQTAAGAGSGKVIGSWDQVQNKVA